MKISSRQLLYFSAWAVTLGMGVLIGRQSGGVVSDESGEVKTRFYQRADRGAASGVGAEPASLRGEPAGRMGLGGKLSLSGSAEERVAQAFSYLSELSAETDVVERNRMLIQLIDQMEASEFQGVIEKFREEGMLETNRGSYSMLLHAWVKHDPMAAVNYVSGSDSDSWSKETVIAAWAMKDPASAAEMVNTLDDGGRVNNWIVGLAQGIGRVDPESAMLTLQELPRSETRGAAMRGVIPNVLERGEDYAMDWLNGMTDTSLQSYAASELASRVAGKNPQEASQWMEGIVEPAAKKAAAGRIADSWARSDLETAKNWVNSLPQDLQANAAPSVASRLARTDPAEGSRWLNGLQGGSELDQARISYAREAGRAAPVQALSVIRQIGDTSQQTRQYHEVIARWVRSDGEASQAWLRENSAVLPESVVRRYVR